MIDTGGLSWGDIGKGLGAIAVGVASYFAGRGKRKVSAAADDAAVADYTADRATADANSA